MNSINMNVRFAFDIMDSLVVQRLGYMTFTHKIRVRFPAGELFVSFIYTLLHCLITLRFFSYPYKYRE